MTSIRSAGLLIVLAILGFPPTRARSQTLSEALDSPGLIWTPSGSVTPLNDPALSHDGVDVVRINSRTDSATTGPWPSMKTTVSGLSVVEFWHRSSDLETITILGRNTVPARISSQWQQERWLQALPEGMTSAEIEIGNHGLKGSGPLYLDELTLRPPTLTTIEEALDFPGFTFTELAYGSAIGLAEGWLAPDGTDAVALSGPGLGVTLPASTLIRFRSRGGDVMPAVNLLADANFSPPSATTIGDATMVWIQHARTYRFAPASPYSPPAVYNQTPVALDAVEVVPTVSIHEALDAPGLALAVLATDGPAIGAPAPPATPDGDALLCLAPPGSDVWGATVTLTVSGPGIVKFSYWGSVNVRRTGDDSGTSYLSTAWETLELPVYRSGETVTFHASGWLNAFSILPPSPETSIATLLDSPGVIPEFLSPVWCGDTMGSAPPGWADKKLLQFKPANGSSESAHLRFRFDGASFVSLRLFNVGQDPPRARIDGGAWQTPSIYGDFPFTAIVPGSGGHTLDISGAGIMTQLRVIPLKSIPLAEALDAPGLTFNTSQTTPWSAYEVPAELGLPGNRAAFGGQHSVAGDPWISTTLTGPGILRAHCDLSSKAGIVDDSKTWPKLQVDAAQTHPTIAPREWLIGPGQHTVRWVQHGSRVQSGSGTLAALYGVSFEPLALVTFDTALEASRPTWTVGGEGHVTPVHWPRDSPDGVDSVQFRTDPASSNPSWLETVIQLPCTLSFSGNGIRVSLGEGQPALFDLLESYKFPGAYDPAASYSIRKTIPGSGPARVRFTALTKDAVLDSLFFEEPTGQLLSTVNLGTPGQNWTQYGGNPWQEFRNDADGIGRYRGQAETKGWMEATVTGPCFLGIPGPLTLPDLDNRRLIDGWLPWPGPQRVLATFPANTLLLMDGHRPTPPLADWSGSPSLTWTTGGDAPWQSTFSRSVRSGPVWPGENSWIEATASGPGVLFWDCRRSSTSVIPFITCNGIAIPAGSLRGWFHLQPGEHRIRWELANPRNGIQNSDAVLFLQNVAFTPQPTHSVSSALSGGLMNFFETAPSLTRAPTAILPWPFTSGWKIVDGPGPPDFAIQGSIESGTLIPLMPTPGHVETLLKMEERPLDIWLPFLVSNATTAAPFDWLTWRNSPYFPVRSGFQTTAAQTVFIPDASVTIGEAVDLPNLTWTADSNPPGLWLPRTSPQSTTTDPDALHLSHAAMGDLAWLETNVTGPLKVTTDFDGTGGNASTGIRIYIDNLPAIAETVTPTNALHLHVPAGTHLLRWEISPLQPIPALSGIAIRRITTSTVTIPDVRTLLDSPDLEWTTSGLTPTPLTPRSATHDLVDALKIGSGGGTFTVSVTGPGILEFWMKGEGSDRPLQLDSIPWPDALNWGSWTKHRIPIPHGRHHLSITGASSNIALDEFSFTAIPSLTPEEALDTPEAVTISIPDPDKVGAAAYPGYSPDGQDVLLLMPGQECRIALHVPPLSSIGLQVRTVSGSGSLAFQDLPPVNLNSSWTKLTFSTQSDSGLNTIYLRADTVPLLLDQLTVFPSTNGPSYFLWAAAMGLAGGQQDSRLDPDGDDLTNFAEYSFGLDPKASDLFSTGTDTIPGLPETSIHEAPDGQQYLEVRFWQRRQVEADIETATDPSGFGLLGDPGGWITALNTPSSTELPEGWIRSIWRSPTPIVPGTRQFARVRIRMP